MPGRLNVVQLGTRTAERLTAEASDELRSARLARGLTQQQLASALGVRRAHISAVERGAKKAMTVDQLARQAAVLGLKLSIKFYPLGTAIRDVAQVRYITRFTERVGAGWRVSLDVPIPLPGDLRAVDILLVGACTIVVEVVTQLRDIQATVRAAQLKKRDLAATRLVIVVAGTHRNRAALAEGRIALSAAFDLDTQRTMAALAAGRDPGRDAIVVLAS